MSSWADQGGAPLQRKKLVLQPRSAKAPSQEPSGGSRKSSSNPFGAAKPREEVLAKKGIDAKLVDLRIEKKSAPPRLTKEQELEVEKLREELTAIEQDLREANEMELPEEKFRVAAEKKRKEVNDLMAKYAEMNVEQTQNTSPAGGVGSSGVNTDGNYPRYERPSERRKRLEKQAGRHGQNSGEDLSYDAYSSFGGR